MIDGSPAQAVAPSPEALLSVVDLSAFAEADREAEALRIAEEEALRPFDLARGPLLRATLLRLGEQEHVLLVTIHHIVFDGWSSDVFDRELEVLYESDLERRPLPLAPLAIQYADFAVWQREWLRGEVLERQLSYWRRQLEGRPAFLELPIRRSRPPVQGFRGATETVSIPKGLARAVRMLGQQEEATLFVTLLAAFQILLQRHSGQDDVVVGSYVAGRNRSDIEELIGFFVNTLVFRTDMAGELSAGRAGAHAVDGRPSVLSDHRTEAEGRTAPVGYPVDDTEICSWIRMVGRRIRRGYWHRPPRGPGLLGPSEVDAGRLLPIREDRLAESIAREILDGAVPTGRSSSSVERIPRSRFEVTASSWARSKRPCCATRPYARPQRCGARTCRVTHV